MSGAQIDLSGKWDGVFSYPDVPEAGPTTPFLASIVDNAGVIKGEVIEPHEYGGHTAHSTILGQRIGASVHFSKTYHDAGWEYEQVVEYFGTLSDGGDTITGEWRIDHFCGPFEMTRERAVEALAEPREEAEIDVS